MLKIALYGVVVLVLAGVGGFFALGMMSQGQSAPGLVEGRLAPCPSSPNCVSSEDGTEADKKVDPLPASAWEKLPQIVTSMGGKVTTQEDSYIAAEFKSATFGFVDDLEFRKGDTGVHVRSGSRVGYSDAGVNAKRVAALRAAVNE